ncbi:serine protease inhibitor 28Dc-like [Anoplophora glabripennis]|uniref:serine protease inhibitor 28Dc-like n=1 Tax=Anoplophora glabripennis TaxID=217634 RepID=UPI0008757341|nr:serine protease inhibitor 28Dc-like [Anoplophora glabripennis]
MTKMFTKFVIPLLVTITYAIAQREMVYFPDEQGGLMDGDNTVKLPSNVNLTEIRGTTLYETFVDKIIASGIAKLTLAVNKALNQQTGSNRDNVVFAPVSIAGALALILLGSNGKTFQEITSVLGLATGIDIESRSLQVHEQFGRMIDKLERTSGFSMGQQVNFAAGVFVQTDYPVRTVYVKTAQDLYDSEVISVDFRRDPSKAQETINSWVSQKTNGKIRNILEEEPLPHTRVIIASAMYFKALWEKPFFEGATTRRPFYTNGRKSPPSAEVEMMANGGDFPYFKDQRLNCEVMGFPYQGNASRMYVVMPVDSNAKKLRELEESLTPTDLERLADSTIYTRAVLVFPKMRIESTIDLKSSLELLGVKSLFIPSQANLALLSPGEKPVNPLPDLAVTARVPLSINRNSESILADIFNDAIDCTKAANTATSPCTNNRTSDQNGRRARASETIDNLRRIINQQSTNNSYQNPGLYADKVIHKVYMDITETGTEAAATTSVSLSRDGGRVTFRVDVPFFFFIRNEETKTILFWGSVTVPTPNFRRSV